MLKRFQQFSEALNFDDVPDRMSKDIKDKIEKDEHLYRKHRAFPKDKNFGEEISAARYRELVDKLRRYTGLEDFDIRSLYGVLMQAVMKIQNIEAAHVEELQNLAIKIVQKEMNIPKGALQFDAKIKGVGQIKLDGVKKKQDKLPEQPIIKAAEIHLDQDQEEMKRRFINGLIQGAANKGHYMFHLVENELNAIDEELLDLYGAMITANDLNYWVWSDEMISQAGEQESAAGKVKIDMSTEPPTIRVEAINFPTLVHELVKGVMEYLSLYGLPKESGKREELLNKTDFLDGEMWDLRFGPQLWDRFVQAIDFDEFDIKEMLYAHLVEMPAAEFNTFMHDLMAGNATGKKKLKDLANDIKKELRQEAYDESIPKDSDDEDDIDDISLADLGF